jgi:hypothetical protein
MKNWTEKPYLYSNNILRTRTRKSKAGELLLAANKRLEAPSRPKCLRPGDWAIVILRHESGVGQITGIVQQRGGKKVLFPVSYEFNPKLAKWKPGPIGMRRIGYTRRIESMEFHQRSLPITKHTWPGARFTLIDRLTF